MSRLLVILSSRVSLTNVARSSDPSPIQQPRRPAVGGDATCPLASDHAPFLRLVLAIRAAPTSTLDMRREPRFEPLRVSDRLCRPAVAPSSSSSSSSSSSTAEPPF